MADANMVEETTGAFERPRYLLGFAEDVDADLVGKVKAWLVKEPKVLIEDVSLPGEGHRAFLVVSAGREHLEGAANGLGYFKQHVKLEPHSPDQGLGKIEFEPNSDKIWREGYQSYGDAGFWLPCEKAQLLKAILLGVSVEGPELEKELAPHVQHLGKLKRDAALNATGSIVTALNIAGLLEVVTPLHNDSKLRLGVWHAGLYNPLAPATKIQDYFGAHVAMYFAWMNTFTTWLILPGTAGLLCSLQMRWSGFTVDDDPYLPFYGFFVVLWSVFFMCHWEWKCAEHAWKWNVFAEEEKEIVRPAFSGELVRSRASGEWVRYYPYWKRVLAFGLSFLVTTIMLGVAFFVMICFLNLQGYMQEHVTSIERMFYFPILAKLVQPGSLLDPNQTEYFGLLTFVPTVLYSLVIMQLNSGYRTVAEWLTWNENHRLDEQHENSLVLKRFCFEAFDCYVALFYVAFVIQDMRKLRNELIGLYTMDSIRRLVLETLIPLVMKIWSRKKTGERYAELKKQDKADHALALEQFEAPEYEQFDDFLEMVIEFGYITLFAGAFPLASVLSVFCNLIEIKSDLFKLTRIYQRPVSKRAASIGTWKTVLWAIIFLSILTNVMIFSMSEQLASWMPSFYRAATETDVAKGLIAGSVDETAGTSDLILKKGTARYVILIAGGLEHFLGLIVLLIVYMYPKKPEWLSEEMARIECYKDRMGSIGRSSIGNVFQGFQQPPTQ